MAGAGLVQIHSFAGKFINLWQSGFDANLHLETVAGKARVTLQSELGEAPTPLRDDQTLQVPGPARLRRRQRRAEVRQADAENVETQVTEQVDQENDAVEAEEVIDDNPTAASVVDSTQSEEHSTTPFEVNDELCNDKDYEKEQETETQTKRELFDVQVTAGEIEALPDEVILEVRPQYDKFDSKLLAERLKQMKLNVLCLPWVANTGRLFYTSGFKISKDNYAEFKANNGGTLPSGIYSVQRSRKLN